MLPYPKAPRCLRRPPRSRAVRWSARFTALSAAIALSLSAASCAMGPEKLATSPVSGASPAGAPSPPPTFAVKSAESEGAARPTTAEEAVAELDRFELDFNRAIASAGRTGPKAEATASPAAPPPPPQVSPGGAAAPARQQSDFEASSGDPCATACRALASMRRSVEHVCELAGDASSQCAGARARVNVAEERVQASCPACSSG